ncbi:MAG: 2-amino-4-hydroxy-6-hydroxymethyldihydropteridine diphosphokinase [Alphaproteobacteria bacterium]|nr:2-amino-4-hydroxy-6-hydroxymethyldihydropteridine diphosphokinase [Alphaproteobacteria bacterium]
MTDASTSTLSSFVLIGLGTNLGDRYTNLISALKFIEDHKLIETMIASPVYETPATLAPESPKEWDKPFLNMCVMGTTHLAPGKLLQQLKECEDKMGRLSPERWSPRVIDIDVLLYGDYQLETPSLTIPHIQFTKRDFALVPAADIAPDTSIPGTPHSIKEWVAKLTENKAVFYADPPRWHS